MMRQLTVLCTGVLLLNGCGLAETAVVAGASGASAAEQAKQAKQTEQKVRDDVAKADQVAADARAAAEAAAQ
ncbi:MAG: hypothetical protein ABI616_13615 [Pseudomonadota bacterium]